MSRKKKGRSTGTDPVQQQVYDLVPAQSTSLSPNQLGINRDSMLRLLGRFTGDAERSCGWTQDMGMNLFSEMSRDRMDTKERIAAFRAASDEKSRSIRNVLETCRIGLGDDLTKNFMGFVLTSADDMKQPEKVGSVKLNQNVRRALHEMDVLVAKKVTES